MGKIEEGNTFNKSATSGKVVVNEGNVLGRLAQKAETFEHYMFLIFDAERHGELTLPKPKQVVPQSTFIPGSSQRESSQIKKGRV